MRNANFHFRSRVFYLLVLLVSIVIIWSACKKDENKDNNTTTTTPTLTNNPTAKADFDNNAGGIYKGIVTGSAGYVYIYFKNTSALVYAILDFDGTHDSLVCTALNSYTLPGTTDITNAMFLSALGKQDTILFSVKADGSNPSMTVKIPGHSTSSSIRKETSKEELRIYKGDIFDTLVQGYYTCGSTNITTIGSVRQSNMTVMVQGTTATLLPSKHLPPCTSSNTPNAFVVQVNNGVIELDEVGPPKKKIKFTVTDAAVTGTATCIPPIDMGGEIDAYNSYITATRVK